MSNASNAGLRFDSQTGMPVKSGAIAYQVVRDFMQILYF